MKELELFRGMDIYLFDQLMKGRIKKDAKILDAGCGTGRNIKAFINENYNVTALDPNESRISLLKETLKNSKAKLLVTTIEEFNTTEKFDFIICNAVLHFANSYETFEKMISKLSELLAINGVLFLRFASNIGIECKVKENDNGEVILKETGCTYLLSTRKQLHLIENNFNLTKIEPTKHLNVDDMRVMTTMVLVKERRD